MNEPTKPLSDEATLNAQQPTYVNEYEERLKRLRDEQITVPFKLFIQLLMNDRRNYFNPEDYENHVEKDWICVPDWLAMIIKTKDVNEIIVHVESVGEYNDKKLPQVWLKPAWDSSLTIIQKRADKFNEERLKKDLRDSKIIELTKAIQRDAGHDEKAAKMLASMIVYNLSIDIAKQFGVDISLVSPDVTTKLKTFIGDLK